MSAEPPALARPQSLTDLFFAFNRLALQGFGGVLAVAQRELVEHRRWLTREDFLELVSAAQVLPGPNVVNLSLMLGDRYFGLRGAFAALAGMLAVPLVIVLLMTTLYAQFADVPAVSGALRGMSAVAAGLILATACKLMMALRKNPLGPVACAAFALATLLAVAAWRLPLATVILALGALAVALAWWRLKP
ncbi:MAG: chromate transporter [Methylibium sp. NZG]|nr:MAG: chromate transporter [Methylibium sp. NZG]